MSWAVLYLLAVVKIEDIMYLKAKARKIAAQGTRLGNGLPLRHG
jgi:hypothetical protein